MQGIDSHHNDNVINILLGTLTSIPTWFGAFIQFGDSVKAVIIGLATSIFLMLLGKLVDIIIYYKIYNKHNGRK